MPLNFNYFHFQVLKNINLTIEKNEKVLLVGHNGAGKSTLLRVICGLHMSRNYDSFAVMGSGAPNNQFNGLVFLADRWVRNTNFVGIHPFKMDILVRNMSKKLQEEYIDRRNELLNVLDIDLDWRMHKVSDGERKRVQIMLNLLKPFKLVIIDEFLNDLDIIVKDRLFQYLDKEIKLHDGSIVFATHVFDNMHNWATHIIFMENGACHSKQNMKDFCQSDLYNRVKEKMMLLDKKMETPTISYGPQMGYGSGRLV